VDHHQVHAAISLFTPSGIIPGYGYRLPKTCPFPNISVTHIQSAFGAVDFVSSFQAFLTKHVPNSRIPASPVDRFNVYKALSIMLPSVPHISDLK
jgi:hypothetical protein